jgi:hypothetical protein
MAYPALSTLNLFTDPKGFAPRFKSRVGMQEFAKADLAVSRELADTTLWFNTATLMATQDDAADVVRAMEKIFSHRDALKAGVS